MAQSCQSAHSGAKRWVEQQQQQFYRSASARLPRSRHPAALDQDEDDYGGGRSSAEQDTRDGERKIQQVCAIDLITDSNTCFFNADVIWKA